MLPTNSDNNIPSLEERQAICRDLGLAAGCVWEVLAIHPEVAHTEVAKTLGIGKRTVQRAVAALTDAGLLKVEHRFKNNWQQVNGYQMPTSSIHSDVGIQGGHFDHPISTNREEEEKVEEEKVEEEIPEGSGSSPEQIAHHRGTGADAPVGSQSETPGGATIPGGWRPGCRFRPPPPRRDIFWHSRLRLAEAEVLFKHFAGRMQQAMGDKTIAKNRPPAWWRTAQAMRFDHSDHSLDENIAVVDYAFGQGAFDPDSEGHWTSLLKMLENYDDVLDEMAGRI